MSPELKQWEKDQYSKLHAAAQGSDITIYGPSSGSQFGQFGVRSGLGLAQADKILSKSGVSFQLRPTMGGAYRLFLLNTPKPVAKRKEPAPPKWKGPSKAPGRR